MVISQYQIVLVNLDPTIGSEIKKTRPCVVISPNEMNNHLNTIVIAPLTSSIKSYPTRVPIKFNNSESSIAIDQIRTIDKSRIIKTFPKISNSEIQILKLIIQETFVD